jgi:SPP1 gp7 family putative phage head morphogenesis protein
MSLPRGFPAPRPPLHLERAYTRELLARVKAQRKSLDKALAPVLRDVGPELDARAEQYTAERRAGTRAPRQDAAPGDDLAQLLDVVNLERTKWQARPPSQRKLERLGMTTAEYAAGQQDKVFRSVYGVQTFAPLQASGEISRWTAANVSLIESIDSRYFDDIERVITEAVREGKNTEALRKDLQRRYSVSESRARLIARDQVAKLNGTIAQDRQQQYGVTRYMWSTSGDERVRDSHAELDGTIQRWDDPPVASENGERGHPGHIFQCRCVPVPVLESDDLAQLQAEQANRQAREAQGLASSPITTGTVTPIARRAPSSKWFKALQARVREQAG